MSSNAKMIFTVDGWAKISLEKRNEADALFLNWRFEMNRRRAKS